MYREQLDDIMGMVHIKDVFAYVGRPESFSLEAILRRPLMVAPQMPVLDLLLQMRQRGCIWRWWWTNTAASTGW